MATAHLDSEVDAFAIRSPGGQSSGPPKIVVHDYAGHPFQVALSRELSRRGYAVLHTYFADDCGPKGELERRPGDAAGLAFAGIRIKGGYDKANLLRRRFGDLAYGRAVARLVQAEKPALVISGNTPTEAQDLILRACRKSSSLCVPWIQDFYSIATSHLLGKRLGSLGRLVGAYYQQSEKRQLGKADAIVIITEQFRELAERWGGDSAKVFTIENWGHLEGIAPLPKTNPWSVRHQVNEGFNFLYSGTLALKHNPLLLARLAARMRERARVIVVGHGVGVDQLAVMKRNDRLDNLLLLPLQPFTELPSTLATADVALAIIEPGAGAFSVPSKVQSYFCSERAVLLASPADNLAAQVVSREHAGLVTEPDGGDAFLDAAERLLADASLRDQMAANGRAYAEKAYHIGAVADRFERVFAHAQDRAWAARNPSSTRIAPLNKGEIPW